MKRYMHFFMVLALVLCIFVGCSDSKEVVFVGSYSSEDTVWLQAINNFSGEILEIPEYDCQGRLITGITRMLLYYSTNSDFSQVTTLILPDSVEEIAEDAFSEFVNLKKLVLGKRSLNIGRLPFLHCPIEEVSVMEDVVPNRYEITDSAIIFSGSGNIPQKILVFSIDGVIPDGIEIIGDGAMAGLSVTEIHIPDSVHSIHEKAFMQCKKLRSIVIPGHIGYIGDSAFYECEDLQSVFLEDGVHIIDNNAFARCYSLNEIQIPDSVGMIGNFAFGFSGLESIPKLGSVTVISKSLFAGSKLKEAQIPEGIQSVEDSAFSDCEELQSINFSSSVRLISNTIFGLNISKNISVDEDNLNYYDDNNCLIDRYDNTLLIAGDTDCITYGIKRIEDNAFYRNQYIDELHIPDTVTTIGDNVFLYSSLKTVYIPLSVETIGQYALGGDELSDIYCEALAKPEGWVENWLIDSNNEVEVHWGYDFGPNRITSETE